MTASGLITRWDSPEGKAKVTEVRRRLLNGRSLSGIDVETIDGRMDFRFIPLNIARFSGAGQRGGVLRALGELGGMIEVRNAHIARADFSHSHLAQLHFFASTIDDCKFERADCRGWRMWKTDVSDASFMLADLRRSMLGAWYDGRGSSFTRVDFRRAKLQGITSVTPTYTDCDFAGARIADTDFQSSSFVRCRFAGLLQNVIFWDHGFETGKPTANEMIDIDFSGAILRSVEFRRLNLDRVILPTSPSHVIVRRYGCVLKRTLSILLTLPNSRATLGLRGLVEHSRHWIGAEQAVGVFHRDDLGSNEEERAYVTELLRQAERDCLDANAGRSIPTS